MVVSGSQWIDRNIEYQFFTMVYVANYGYINTVCMYIYMGICTSSRAKPKIRYNYYDPKALTFIENSNNRGLCSCFKRQEYTSAYIQDLSLPEYLDLKKQGYSNLHIYEILITN